MLLPNFVNKFVFRLRARVSHYFPSSTAVMSPNSPGTVGLSLDESVMTMRPDEWLEVVERNPPVVAAAGTNFDLSTLFMAFCLTSGVEIALYSLQAGNGRSDQDDDHHDSLPFVFPVVVICYFTCLCVTLRGKIYEVPAESELLERAGILFAITAFYLAMTMPFPLFFKVCSWGVYLFSLLAIAICNRY